MGFLMFGLPIIPIANPLDASQVKWISTIEFARYQAQAEAEGVDIWYIITGTHPPTAVTSPIQSVVFDPTVSLQDALDAFNAQLAAHSSNPPVLTVADIYALRRQQFTNYFLASKSSVVMLETLELSHPGFSQTYRIVRNSINGMIARIEDGTSAEFNYYPVKITPTRNAEDLDFGLQITVGDLGEEFPKELDRTLKYPGGVMIKPTLIYRTFRSDDLTKPMYGPLRLQLSGLSFNAEGVSFEAKAPALNNNRTGEVYSLTRFPMMRGFI